MRTKKTIPIIGNPGSTKSEAFKRPNHPDFMDSFELKKNNFTGIRKNNIGLQWEFWILGRMEKTVSFAEVQKDPYALTKAHVDLFGLTPDSSIFKR